MDKPVYIALQPSEAVVAQSASNIYAAYITRGYVKEGQEKEWMKRATDEAIWIAQSVDHRVQSDSEMS